MISYTPRMTDTFAISLELKERLQRGTSLYDAFEALTIRFRFQRINILSGTPHHIRFAAWSNCFTTGKSPESYRSLTRQQELADLFGLDKIPGESVLSRTWRNRFDDAGRAFVTNGAHDLVWKIENGDFYAPEVRPPSVFG